jgi:glycosyltransferase involved in cell wall biosynthesis
MMQSFTALVLPSRTTANWKEQFGRVIIEAMACGTPVIGSDSGEIPHVIGAGGATFPEGDAGALAAVIQAICTDPSRLESIRTEARQRVLAHYTQTALAAQYVDIYRQMAATRPRT